MVCINTHHSKVQFKHFVEVPSSDCVIGTAHDDKQRTKLYLIVNGSGPIYKRNGINDTWDELDNEQYETIRKLVKNALADSSVPHYTTDNSVLN